MEKNSSIGKSSQFQWQKYIKFKSNWPCQLLKRTHTHLSLLLLAASKIITIQIANHQNKTPIRYLFHILSIFFKEKRRSYRVVKMHNWKINKNIFKKIQKLKRNKNNIKLENVLLYCKLIIILKNILNFHFFFHWALPNTM